MGDQQKSLNQLLQWGIENSDTSREANPSDAPRDATRGLDPDMLAQLLGGPSDADLMRESMTAIVAPAAEVDLESKLVAFDNLEQLIEQIDNANNMEGLGLWPPLLRQLDSDEAELRRMAAWCCGTAVQNNVKSQERLLAHDGVAKLARVAVLDVRPEVRKKAITALSSEVRNFQPGLDALEVALPDSVWTQGRTSLDASDMEAVDQIIGKLRENVSNM